MTERCVKCCAPLTTEEKFYFYCSCERCEVDTLVVRDENHRWVKSPALMLRLLLFYLRRCWFRYFYRQRKS